MRRTRLVVAAVALTLSLAAGPALAATGSATSMPATIDGTAAGVSGPEPVTIHDATPAVCDAGAPGVDGCLDLSAGTGVPPDVAVVAALLLAFIGYTAADGMTPRRAGG